MALEIGDAAPDFRLRDQDGVERTLAELNDGPLLLAFYPADGTPGCTTQACDIRDRWDEFEALGVRVVGVSPDDVATHRSLRVRARPPPHAARRPGAPRPRGLRRLGGEGPLRPHERRRDPLERADRGDGRILKHWRRAQAKAHAERALKACRELLR
jgi:thioredoxin-dependent peroxiredoxin